MTKINPAIQAAAQLLRSSNSSLRGDTQLNEELTDKQMRHADKMKEAGHSYYNDQFILNHAHPDTYSKFQFDEKTGRKVIRIPIELNRDNPEPSYTVKGFLKDHGYHIKDAHSYRQGIAHKEITTGDPEKGIPYRSKLQATKIGALLEKHGASDSVKQAYQHDPVRVGLGKHDYDLVISHHPHDVYGMSTGRGWTSCADMDNGGAAADCMPAEINKHTHVAYLVERGGDYDKEAIARLAFKHHRAVSAKSDQSPHENHQTLISEKRVYGSAPTDFRTVAEHHMAQLFPIKNDTYVKTSGTYNDSGEVFHTPEGHKISAETLDTMWKMSDNDQKPHLYSHVGLEGKFKSKKLREVQHALKEIHQEPSPSFEENMDRIRSASYGLDTNQKMYGITRNNNFDSDHMSRLIEKNSKNFDPTNSDHTLQVRLFGFDHPLRHPLYRGLSQGLKPVKTVDDFVKGNALHSILGNRDSEGLPVDNEHELGHDPIGKLAHSGALKNEADYQKAYFTFHSHPSNHVNDNWYNTVHRLNDENAPNAHLAMNKITNDLMKDSKPVIALHVMHPHVRKFFEDQTGHNYEKLASENKSMLDWYDKKTNS